MTASDAAFDPLVDEYDATFSDTPLGRALRERVWAVLDPLVAPGIRVLELNCGTGEDAAHLAGRGAEVLATDVSARMLAATDHKAARAGLGDRVTTQLLAIEALHELEPRAGGFDLVLSNFGGLNCVAALRPVGEQLARLVRRGGDAVLVVMGPYVPWEWAWYLVHGDPRRAVRRLRGRAEWRGTAIHYPSPSALRRALSPWFEVVATRPIGVALPPSYAGEWFNDRPEWLARFEHAEDVFARVPGTAWLGDHYLVQLRRGGTAG